jgi:hypothetical protein
MIELPSNITVAALAILLGAVLGVGGYHVLAPLTTQEAATETLQDRTAIYDLDRYLQPRDTTSKAQADREIRYKTRTVRDTVRQVDSVFVPIPSYYDEPLVSDAEPLQVTPDRVNWTTWNPRERRHEQRVYEVPEETFEAQLYALVQARNPPSLGLEPFRVGAGIGGKVRYRSVGARLEATLSQRLRPELEAALTWTF